MLASVVEREKSKMRQGQTVDLREVESKSLLSSEETCCSLLGVDVEVQCVTDGECVLKEIERECVRERERESEEK